MSRALEGLALEFVAMVAGNNTQRDTYGTNELDADQREEFADGLADGWDALIVRARYIMEHVQDGATPQKLAQDAVNMVWNTFFTPTGTPSVQRLACGCLVERIEHPADEGLRTRISLVIYRHPHASRCTILHRIVQECAALEARAMPNRPDDWKGFLEAAASYIGSSIVNDVSKETLSDLRWLAKIATAENC